MRSTNATFNTMFFRKSNRLSFDKIIYCVSGFVKTRFGIFWNKFRNNPRKQVYTLTLNVG